MNSIADIVSQTPGAVFAVGPGLEIQAWNQTAAEITGLPESSVLGRVCYDVVRAVDADTGHPCHEACPLVHPALGSGWVHSRVLTTRSPEGAVVHLDCVLLHLGHPSIGRGTLSVLTPVTPSGAGSQLRLMAALEALYPVMISRLTPEQAIPRILEVVRAATCADIAEILLLESLAGVSPRRFRVPLDGPSEGAAELVSPADVLALGAQSGGVLVTARTGSRWNTSGVAGWVLAAPILDEGTLIGILSAAGTGPNFSIGHAARILFAVAGQVSVFLRWSIFNATRRGLPEGQGPAASGPELRLYCLGQFRVVRSRGGQDWEIPLGQFRRPQKALALLKILAAHRGRTLSRDVLADLLWPEADPVLAANNLRVVLHDLRRSLEPELVHGQPSSFVGRLGDQLYLDPSGRCWLDVEEFDRLVRDTEELSRQGQIKAAVAVGRTAAGLYRGDYLADDPYADWCAAERERLREQYLSLLQRLADLEAQQGEFADAILLCRRALAVDPLREQSHRQMMLLLARAGRRDEAIR